MAGQYLTAVFELRPSVRKAAAMERVRAAAEAVFWDALGTLRGRADEIAAVGDHKQRKEDWRAGEASIARTVLVAAINRGLSESVAQGLVRDVTMAVGSYVELCAKGHDRS